MSDTEKPAGLDKVKAYIAETYTTRDPFEILSDTREEPPEIWGGLTLQRGQLMEVIGSSGLGKSRLMLNLAINQILGREFAGMPTYSTPLTWLFFGNENSFFRYRYDLRKMVSILNTEEQEKLRGRIWLPTVENPGDSYLSFSDEDNIAKFKATIEERKPDVLVLDPWGAIIDGDELSDQDVRQTLSMLLKAINEVSKEKPLPVIILNHSRMGIKEMVKASGPDAANFGKNSKAIFTVMRNVWNLRRGSEEGAEEQIVELIHAKCSDRKLYPKSAVELNPNTLHYNHLPNFQHDAWQLKLEAEAKNPSQMSNIEKATARQQKREENINFIKKMFEESENLIPTQELEDAAAENGIPKNEARKIKADLKNAGFIVELVERKKGGRSYYGLKEMAAKFFMSHSDEYKMQ